MSLEKLGPSQTHTGERPFTPTEDQDTGQLLCAVIEQLKILNFHMQILTDTHINKTDV